MDTLEAVAGEQKRLLSDREIVRGLVFGELVLCSPVDSKYFSSWKRDGQEYEIHLRAREAHEPFSEYQVAR